ncbi:YqzL family protein [Salirhabdus salicampi]|nr:YqzL family protein [Salirhabdus salicampi]MCP8616895.1 YqzL family protein [Salirhabdus salicampi]
MIELPWKVFSQTGNIETYLLMKELEDTYDQTVNGNEEEEIVELDTNI